MVVESIAVLYYYYHYLVLLSMDLLEHVWVVHRHLDRAAQLAAA